MAGIFDRLQYDECATEQYTTTTKSPELYQIFLPYNENYVTSKQNQGAKLPQTLQSKDRRVEIENDLLLLALPESKCANKKFQACEPSGKNKCDYENVVVPMLNDREIVPTNMLQFKPKMSTSVPS
jgi:deoxyribodipyrimidine photolyase